MANQNHEWYLRPTPRSAAQQATREIEREFSRATNNSTGPHRLACLSVNDTSANCPSLKMDVCPSCGPRVCLSVLLHHQTALDRRRHVCDCPSVSQQSESSCGCRARWSISLCGYAVSQTTTRMKPVWTAWYTNIDGKINSFLSSLGAGTACTDSR